MRGQTQQWNSPSIQRTLRQYDLTFYLLLFLQLTWYLRSQLGTAVVPRRMLQHKRCRALRILEASGRLGLDGDGHPGIGEGRGGIMRVDHTIALREF